MPTLAAKYRPRFYGVLVTVPADAGPPVLCPAGRANEASFNVTDIPFVVKRVSAQIIGNNGLGVTPIETAQQDGQFAIEWRTERHNYQNQPIAGVAGYGFNNDHPDLPSPVEMGAKTTVTVRVLNLIARGSALQLQVVFAGVEPNVGTMEA